MSRVCRAGLICALIGAAGLWADAAHALAGAATRAQAGAAARGPASEATRPASFSQLARQADEARLAGRTEEALDLYRRALRLKPSWPEGQWYLGAGYYELGRFHEAERSFESLIVMQPENGGAWAMKGLAGYGLGRYEQALVDLMKARDIGLGANPDLADVARYHTGILMTRFEQYEYAIETLNAFAVQGNDSASVIEALGLATLRMPVLPSEMADDQRDRVMLAGRAAYALGRKSAAEARTALEALVARYGATPNVHYAYGLFLLKSEPDRAIDEFTTEIRISPAHAAARLQLALEYIKRVDWESAEKWARAAAETAPFNAAARQALGQVLLERGVLDEAIAELEKSRTLLPASPTVHYLLSRAYQKAGRAADAERERLEFVRLGRQSPAERQASGASEPAEPAHDDTPH